MKVLVVEDDAELARVVTITLEAGFPGLHPLVASDGKSALHCFHMEYPDLVVMDVGLPDMDGFEVCRELRKSSDVPIIMLTARDLVEDKIEGLTCGADDYVVKPFVPLELIARIQAVLRRSQVRERKEPEPVQPNSATAEERILQYLQSHPEGTDFATAKKAAGVYGMDFVGLVARLQDEHKIRKEGLTLFAA